MRVLHAPNNIAGLSNILANAERDLGIESFSYSIHRSPFHYHTDIEIDEKSNRILHVVFNAIMLGLKFDVFLFYFGESLLGPYLWDVPILKKLGKKIFFYFHGCDLRDSKKIIESKRRSACEICWPQL